MIIKKTYTITLSNYESGAMDKQQSIRNIENNIDRREKLLIEIKKELDEFKEALTELESMSDN